ncbi:extracellular solute-binding protein [Pyxidicoccus caerfyrddinensis]|uniref:extracellular solute-binding protein n=1 Tax=Pyxidicoccus caerfyrddinensis TaxID=2709663 RepID=UPI0013D9D0F7|nr:extracellular solute-binding protein [Pyxidicoccus caerfyrddinensis]
MRHRALGCIVLLAVCACAGQQKPPPAQTRQLKAVLFPYIPDSAGDEFSALKQALEKGFEQKHPDIDLTVVIDDDVDLYDLNDGGALNRLLGDSAEAAQVVEVDMLLLGDLVSRGWIQPVQLTSADVLPSARQATAIQGTSYAVPTYLCSHVVYTGNPDFGSATDGQSLIRILSSSQPGRTPLVSNYKGSWTLPAIYMDAWADTHSADGLEKALELPLDAKTMTRLDEVVDSCAPGGATNPCLDGSYEDNTRAEETFAQGKANGFVGFTERLFFIRKSNPAMPLPHAISVPLGGGTHPTLFVDGLVFNAKCSGACLQAAQAFATYMSTPEVRALIAFSQDAPPGASPRYLLQASQPFYKKTAAASDPMYQQFILFLDTARPYPNQGFPAVRKALQQALLKELQPGPTPPPSAP